jgi:hypothetical protein
VLIDKNSQCSHFVQPFSRSSSQNQYCILFPTTLPLRLDIISYLDNLIIQRSKSVINLDFYPSIFYLISVLVIKSKILNGIG